MLNWVTTSRKADAVREFIAAVGRPLADMVAWIGYEDLLARAAPPPGDWLFCDIERLPASRLRRAAALAQGFVEAGRKVVNHPGHAMARYELLRTLHLRGINDFDVVRLTECRWPESFPVCLQHESGDGGAIGGLLPDHDALQAVIDELAAQGRARDSVLAVGHVDTADPDGRRAEYSVFRIGGRYVPAHIAVSGLVAGGGTGESSETDSELAFFADNPHIDFVRDVFRLARIEFGRLDYGFCGGRPQAFGVDTNPELLMATGESPAQRTLGELRRRAIVEAMLAMAKPRPWTPAAPPPVAAIRSPA